MKLFQEGRDLFQICTTLISFQLEILKKKIKIYGFQSKIGVEMNKLGEIVYNLFQENGKDILINKEISGLVYSIKDQKEVIKNTEKEIIEIHTNFEEVKEKMYYSGRCLLKRFKIESSPYKEGDSNINYDVQHKPLNQNISEREGEKKEVKEAKETTKKMYHCKNN